MIDLNVDNLVIDNDLFADDAQGESFPAIAWHGRYGSSNVKGGGGFFAIDKDAIDGVPEGWEEDAIQYGDDPKADFVEVYKTSKLVCTPIGVRKRIIVRDENGNDHYYPWRTPKNQRVEGRFTSHYQVMVLVPGIDEPVVIGLRGQTKTTCWDNEVGGRYRNNDFPTGVEQLLKAFAHAASQQNGYLLPKLCMWQIALVPLNVQGEPHYVQMGRGNSVAHMNPFTAIMNAKEREYIAAKFVGKEAFAENQTLRQEVALKWEQEWKDAEVMSQRSSVQFAAAVVEDNIDAIPF